MYGAMSRDASMISSYHLGIGEQRLVRHRSFAVLDYIVRRQRRVLLHFQQPAPFCQYGNIVRQEAPDLFRYFPICRLDQRYPPNILYDILYIQKPFIFDRRLSFM